jgi:hypothetical protein
VRRHEREKRGKKYTPIKEKKRDATLTVHNHTWDTTANQ